ncbi:hypothetical protein RCO27_02720 [Sphingosinicella sp. LHD-64]|uniref:hypothetical protein n=1 Tax=Sphingosinicella sp. LHD-64 TaxID=3072139 RepID=UPI00280D8A51|nr:hypothetical protein [Sphingosinicella sp. LHD-64]MDQ8755133.1 hypothetical protein [Sphingosinicella sp. LHD-64]
MELILALLSLLTAATGALTGVRAPEAGLQQAAQVGTVRALAPSAVRAARAVVHQAAATPAAPRNVVDSLPAFALTPAAPLDTVRLIE